MLITYDPEADAMYVRLRQGQVAETEEVATNVMFDYDADENVLGIEILGASQAVEDPFTVSLRLLSKARARRQGELAGAD